MLTDKQLDELCQPVYGYTADALASMLHNVCDTRIGFDPGTITFVIPKTYYSQINNFVVGAIKRTLLEALKTIEPEIRSDERRRISERLLKPPATDR